jgi:hypothetical protein
VAAGRGPAAPRPRADSPAVRGGKPAARALALSAGAPPESVRRAPRERELPAAGLGEPGPRAPKLPAVRLRVGSPAWVLPPS